MGRLEEIEHENLMSGGDRDITWLINLVKHLTKAIEHIHLKSDVSWIQKFCLDILEEIQLLTKRDL